MRSRIITAAVVALFVLACAAYVAMRPWVLTPPVHEGVIGGAP